MAIVVRVPASAANLGPGLDTVAVAVDLENTFRFEQSPADRLVIEGAQASHLSPADAQGIFRAVDTVFQERARTRPPLAVTVTCVVPIGKGLGSSATAIVAGVMAGHALLDVPLTAHAMLAHAGRLEGHPDNVAAALLGGVTVAYTVEGRIEAVRVPHPEQLVAVCLVPGQSLSTARARRVLPEQVPLKDAVFNLSRVALLVGGLASGNLDWLRSASEDRLHQPYRAHLVPGLDVLIASALGSGGLSASLSGAGPTIIALSDREHATAVADGWQGALRALNVAAVVAVLDIAGRGARVARF